MKALKLSRRDLIRSVSLTTAGMALAACQPKVVTEVVKETVEIERVVKETVVIEGTPQVVEKVIKEVVTATPSIKVAAGPVTITYWTGWYTDWAKAMEAMRQTGEWQDYFGDVTVEDSGAAGAKFLTAMAGGNPPDAMSHFDYADYFARGVMLPLEDYIDASKIIDLDDYYESGINTGQFAGHQYGLPGIETFGRYGLYMNSALVGEAGLDINNPPETLSDMWEWHEALTEFDDAGNIKKMGWDPCGNMIGHLQWLDFGAALSMGWQSFDKTTGTYHYDDPRMVEWFEMTNKFYEHLGPDNMTGFRQSFGMWGGDFEKSVMAMKVTGYWGAARAYNANPEVSKNVMVSWMPVADDRRGEKVYMLNWHSVCIPLHAKHPDEAFRLKEFLLHDDAALTTIFDVLGWVNGTRKSTMPLYDLGAYTGLQWFGDAISEATTIPEADMNPLAEFARTTYYDVREQCYRGEIGPQEAADVLQAEATKEYQRQFQS